MPDGWYIPVLITAIAACCLIAVGWKLQTWWDEGHAHYVQGVAYDADVRDEETPTEEERLAQWAALRGHKDTLLMRGVSEGEKK